MALTTTLIENEPPTELNNVQANLGAYHGLAGSIRGGYKESLTSVGVGLISRIYAGQLDKSNGLEPYDEDTFKAKYGDGKETGFEFKKDETPTQAELRYQDYIDVQVQQHRAQSIGGFGQFVGGMIGNMASPVDLGLAFVPYAGMAKIAQAASVSFRTGKKMSAVMKTASRLGPLDAAVAAGKAPSIFKTTGSLAKYGFAEQTAENAAVWAMSQEIGRDYGGLDFIADTLLGGSIVSGVSFFGARKLNKQYGIMSEFIKDQQLMSDAIESSDVGGIAYILDKNSREFRAATTGRKDVMDAMALSPYEIGLDENAHHRETLMTFITEHEDALWFERIKGLIPRDPDIPITESIINQMVTAARIREAVQTNRVDELTPREIEIAIQADLDIADIRANIEGSKETPLDITPEPDGRSLIVERNSRIIRQRQTSIGSRITRVRELEAELKPMQEEAARLREELKTLTGSKQQSKRKTLSYLEKRMDNLNKQITKTGSRNRLNIETGRRVTSQDSDVDSDVDSPIDLDKADAEELLREAESLAKDTRDLHRETGALARKIAKAKGLSKKKQEQLTELLLASTKEETRLLDIVKKAKANADQANRRHLKNLSEYEALMRKGESRTLTLDEEARIVSLERSLEKNEATKAKNDKALVDAERELKSQISKTKNTVGKDIKKEIEDLRFEVEALENDPRFQDSDKIEAARKKYAEDVDFYRSYLADTYEVAPTLEVTADTQPTTAPKLRPNMGQRAKVEKELTSARKKLSALERELEEYKLRNELQEERAAEIQGAVGDMESDFDTQISEASASVAEAELDVKKAEDDLARIMEAEERKALAQERLQKKHSKAVAERDAALAERDEAALQLQKAEVAEEASSNQAFDGNGTYHGTRKLADTLRRKEQKLAKRQDVVDTIELEGERLQENLAEDGGMVEDSGFYEHELSGQRQLLEDAIRFKERLEAQKRASDSTTKIETEKDVITRKKLESDLAEAREQVSRLESRPNMGQMDSIGSQKGSSAHASKQVTLFAGNFLKALGFDVPVKARRKEGTMAHYSGEEGTIYFDPDVRPDRALQLTFHELVHHFKNTDIKTYEKLNAVVARFLLDKEFMDKIFTPELRKRYLYNFYEEADKLFGSDLNDPTIFSKVQALAREKIYEEEIAWFMTEATKHPEFWRALKQRDPAAFEKFRSWLLRLWDMIKGDTRIDRSKMTADQKLAMQQFGEIVAAAQSAGGKDITKLRKLLSDMDKLNTAEALQTKLDNIYTQSDNMSDSGFSDADIDAYLDKSGASELESEIARVTKEEGDQHQALWEEYLNTAKELGIDPYDFITKKGDMDALDPEAPRPTSPDPQAQASKLEAELQANSAEKVKAAEARRAEKRKKVENSANEIATTFEASRRNDIARVQMLTNTWFPWLSKRSKDSSSSQDGAINDFKQFLVSLIEDTDTNLTTLSVDQLLELVPEGKLDYSVEVMKDLFKTKSFHAKARGAGENYFRKPDTQNEGFVGPDNIGEQFAREVRRLTMMIEKGDMSPVEASKAYRDYVDAKEASELLGKLHNESSQRRHDRMLEGKSEKQKLKYLKTFLDGLNRMGVNLRGSSVSHSISAQITTSQAPLLEVLTKHKMIDAFDADPEDILMKALMEATRTGKIPSEWKGENEAVFKEILEVYQMTNKALNVELNKYGAGILYREDHTGVSHRWDGSSMLSKGYDEWRNDMIEGVDWEAVELNLGGVLVGKKNQFGRAQDFVKFDREAYLKAMWKELTGPRSEKDHPSMDIAKSFGKHRNIILKPESEIAILKKYSGHDNIGRLYLDQIRYRAEMVAIARELGNNPIPNYRKVIADAGIDEGVNTTRSSGKLGNKLHEYDAKTLDWTLSNLTGRLDNPVDLDIAKYSKTFRQVSHLLYLWTSGVSAITDIPMTISTMQQLGVTNSTSELVSAFTRAATRRLLKEGDTTRRFLTSMGANYDAMMNAGSRHMGLPDSKTSGNLISNLSDAMFSLNGLNAWTGIMQEAFMDVLSRDLADSIKVGAIDPSMIISLRAAGIEADQFLGMKHAITDVMGVKRFDVHKAGDPETVRKLMAFFAKYRDEAIMMPDASTGAMIRAGQRSGTFRGEAMRSLFQYQAFPLAMNRVTARKFLINAEGERPWNTGQVTFSRMVGFISGMLAMAYVSTVVKDILRGREPMHLGNMTAASWLRIVNQSGVGGLLQTSMEVGAGNPKAALAPLPADMLKMLGSENVGEFIYRSRNLWSGGNNPAAPLIQKAVAAVFPEMVGIHFKILNDYHERNTGQGALITAPRP